jgi:hypothetical protein
MIEALCADNAEAVLQAVVEKAKAGDMTAAKLILERLCPPAREWPREPIEGIDLNSETGSIAALQQIAMRAAEGTLPPAEGKDLMTLIAAVVQARRTEIESQFAVAFAQMRAVLEERGLPALHEPASPSAETR